MLKSIWKWLNTESGSKRNVKQPELPEKLDQFSEDSYDLAVATLKVMAICDKYGQKGMSEMASEVNRQVGEKILQRGLRRWQI